MNLSDMRQLLEERGIHLTKSLGQNFLHDVHHLMRIAEAAELMQTDQVLEIGPGLGPLTEHLIARVGNVLAVEKDARLFTVLEERFGVRQACTPPDVEKPSPGGQAGSQWAGVGAETCGSPVLRLLRADALKWLKQEKRDWSDWKVVSNLPYSVASPILVELCQGQRSPQMMVTTLQMEVARRLMAEPGTKDYGVLTLLVQPDFALVHWFKIPASCFFPQPAVDSACVVFKRRSRLLLPDALRPAYVRLVKRAFSQRRKMMLKLLKPDWQSGRLEAAFERIGLSPQIRAEAVSVEQFVELTRVLTGE